MGKAALEANWYRWHLYDVGSSFDFFFFLINNIKKCFLTFKSQSISSQPVYLLGLSVLLLLLIFVFSSGKKNHLQT